MDHVYMFNVPEEGDGNPDPRFRRRFGPGQHSKPVALRIQAGNQFFR